VSFSALSLRSLRLGGKHQAHHDFNRREAENAETAQRGTRSLQVERLFQPAHHHFKLTSLDHGLVVTTNK